MSLSKANHKECYNIREKFCYLCGDYIKENERRKFSGKVLLDFYECYEFIPDLIHSYKANGIHNSCRSNLSSHVNSGYELKYSIPTIWKKPKSDHSNCHICNAEFYFKQARHSTTVKYLEKSNIVKAEPNNQQGICQHNLDNEYDSDDAPDTFSEFESSEEEDNFDEDPSFELPNSNLQNNEKPKFSQDEISSLINFMNLSPGTHGKLLASFLKKNKLCDKDFRIGYYDNYYLELQNCFAKYDDDTAYIKDIYGESYRSIIHI